MCQHVHIPAGYRRACRVCGRHARTRRARCRTARLGRGPRTIAIVCGTLRLCTVAGFIISRAYILTAGLARGVLILGRAAARRTRTRTGTRICTRATRPAAGCGTVCNGVCRLVCTGRTGAKRCSVRRSQIFSGTDTYCARCCVCVRGRGCTAVGISRRTCRAAAGACRGISVGRCTDRTAGRAAVIHGMRGFIRTGRTGAKCRAVCGSDVLAACNANLTLCRRGLVRRRVCGISAGAVCARRRP